MKLNKKFFTRKTSLSIKTFPDLYQEITTFYRPDWLWLVGAFSIAFSVMITIYCLIILPNDATLTTILTLVMLIGYLILIFLILFLAYSSGQNLRRTVPDIIVNLLIFYPKPYQEGFGLDYDDIQQLKKIAEIEQNSADWRGSYINFVIISIVAFLIANPQTIINFIIAPVYQSFTKQFTNGLPNGWGKYLPTFSYTENIIGALFFIFLVIWVLYKWMSYFRDFISSEHANRAILMACEELSAIYRIKNLSPEKQLLFHERRALIEIYDFHLVPYEKSNLIDKGWGPMDLGKNGLWILIPPAMYSFETRIGIVYKWIKNIGKKKIKKVSNK